MTNVLLTGAGLLGCETARMLSARGQACVLLDICPPSQDIIDLPCITFVRSDITNIDTLEQLSDQYGINAIIHTAAVLSSGMRANPLHGLQVNLMGTANLLELARRLSMRRFITSSSTTVLYSGFSNLGPDPICEDAALRLISDRPSSLYSHTKVSNEQLGLLYRDLFDVDFIALRFSAVLGGKGDTPTSIPGQLFTKLIKAAKFHHHLDLEDPLLLWGGTEEFVDIRDCARAFLHALDAPSPEQAIYNIAHPQLWTLDEVIETVGHVLGKFSCKHPHPITTGFAGFPHIRPAASSTEAASRELGFQCQYDLENTIRHWWGD